MKGVLFTRRSPPEWGAYCTPILNQSRRPASAIGEDEGPLFSGDPVKPTPLIVANRIGEDRPARRHCSAPTEGEKISATFEEISVIKAQRARHMEGRSGVSAWEFDCPYAGNQLEIRHR
jgi:hypothetical protein